MPSFVYLLACFYEKHLKSHIYFYLDDSELWKQYHSVSQDMMEQICDLETVKRREIPIKVCVIFYYIEICYRGCGEKTSFLAIIYYTQMYRVAEAATGGVL